MLYLSRIRVKFGYGGCLAAGGFQTQGRWAQKPLRGGGECPGGGEEAGVWKQAVGQRGREAQETVMLYLSGIRVTESIKWE